MFIQNSILFTGVSLILIFPFLSHPLSMGLTILLLTIIIASSLGLMLTNLWLSYVLVLVLLGGLLVIFIYVSLLAPNELFSQKFDYIFWFFGLLLFLAFLTFNFLKESLSLNDGFSSFSRMKTLGNEWLSSLYSWDLSYLTLFLIIYLFLTLIIIVNITKNDFSSLRSSN